MKTALLFFSDVHYSGARPESEGVVLNAFKDDVKEQIKKQGADLVFALIGGDLGQAADNAAS